MLHLDEQFNGSKIELDVGEEFKVSLPENPSTGFRWNPLSSGDPVCRLLDNSFDLDGNIPGNAGSHSWRFQAVKEGSAKIEFAYGRSWEHDKPPARTFTLGVNVRT